MMNRLLAMSLLLLSACGAKEPSTENVATYNVDRDRITVSGVSSGAMMATQMHVAMSDLIGGAAMIAGGPYYCAEGSLKKGLGPCMKGGDVGVESLVEYTKSAAAAGLIDDPANLVDDTVWMFHGKNDIVMHVDVTTAASEFYSALTNIAPIVVKHVKAPHGFPTMYAGASCTAMAEPYLNACKYDAAREMLLATNGDLEPRGEATGDLIEIPQPGASGATMLPTALAYVPASCRDGALCGVHIAFHGCQQSTAFVEDAFARKAGFNEWAETNNLIVLYPQVDSSKIAPLNPMGCWDWWGYTNEHYATRNGEQISVVKATLDLLAGKPL